MHLRRQVWEELCQFGALMQGPWCVRGDFNSVLFAHEKDEGASSTSMTVICSSSVLICLG